MVNWYTLILSVLGGQAVLLTIIKFLCENFVKYRLTKDLEDHKKKVDQQNAIEIETLKARLKIASDEQTEKLKKALKAEADAELEHLRSKLSSLAKEKEIRFTRYYNKMGEALENSYGKLHNLYDAVYFFSANGAREPFTEEGITQARVDFQSSFYPKRIYFPQHLASKFIHIFMELVFNHLPNNMHDIRKIHKSIEESGLGDCLKELCNDIRKEIVDPKPILLTDRDSSEESDHQEK